MAVKSPPQVQPEERPASEFSDDYHDYVFKNGKLVGDFDNMYRHSKEVPWHQDRVCNLWSSGVGMLMVRERAPFDHILEIGCGLGYIAQYLKPLARSSVDAFDVSPEAIRRAKELHPGINFSVADIAESEFAPTRQYDLVVIRDVFWYVFPKLDTVLSNISRCVKSGGALQVSQSFPALDKPFVGKDVIPSPEALIRILGEYRPLLTAILRNHHLENDGPILHFLGTKEA